ncbi:MAG TPA: hypothetical protein VMV10_25040 [Pirellulales bacterium]|nr:hypothetical protein [Pirellulales bacterium]
MDNSELNRRDFQRLSMAAFGGMLVGISAAGAAEDKGKDEGKGKGKEKNPLLSDPHVCRGLNTCKGKGAGKKNACAGQGACATAKEHSCHTDNQCKGQGGCGAHPGENACKGKGECAVPLHGKAWDKARKRFEELMKKDGKKVGPAPKEKK